MGSLEIVKNKIIELLSTHAKDPEESLSIALLLANKCFEMGHLYSDMGFESRKVMNDFMTLHFPALAAKKPADIRWKKYLFDSIGEIAPACWQCKDSGNCFKCDILEKSA